MNKHGGAKWSHSKKHPVRDRCACWVDVDGAVNRDKSDRPSEWLPEAGGLMTTAILGWSSLSGYDIPLSPEDVKVVGTISEIIQADKSI